MNNLSPAVRKVIYLLLIVVLIIPLSFVALPVTRDASGKIKNEAGGKLSLLREKYSLSQAKLGEIDPASETMKLASLGLRGVAVSTLWMQAMEQQKKEEYDKMASTLKTLTKIQPNFVKVWEYQAHNLAFNVSMEFDDFEYRYYWVKQGLAFLKEGVPYNKTDHRMTDNLGMYTGNKMGKSDEKSSFRRMFGRDDEFHQLMSDFIDPDSYATIGQGHGHDSWKMAYQWYDYSRDLVLEKSCPIRTSDVLFYMYRPSQLRQMGLSLQTEFRPDEMQQEVWRSAQDEWRQYSEIPMTNTLGVTYTMEGMASYEQLLEKYRGQLDEFSPGSRVELVSKWWAQLQLPDEALAAWKLPIVERTDEQNALARMVSERLNDADATLDQEIARRAKPDDRFTALGLVDEIEKVKRQIQTNYKDSSTINYTFWKDRTAAESSAVGLLAREALYDADEMRRQSIYDDEFDRDYRTKEITITKRGAISQYLDAFEKWHDLFEQNPGLKSGPLSDDLATAMSLFKGMLTTTNRDWPSDFPLQDLIDFRKAEGLADGLPTTEELNELRSGLGKETEAGKETGAGESQTPELKPNSGSEVPIPEIKPLNLVAEPPAPEKTGEEKSPADAGKV